MTATNKRFFLNLVLLLIVLGLVWFVYHQMHSSKRADTLYDDAMGSEIISITVFHQKDPLNTGSAPTLEMQKNDGKWQITKPIYAEVDANKIKHLLTLLSERVDARYPVKGNNLAAFGLDQEKLSVSFNGVKLQFGTTNPVSHKRYLRKGDSIYLVDETVQGLLRSGTTGFGQKSSN